MMDGWMDGFVDGGMTGSQERLLGPCTRAQHREGFSKVAKASTAPVHHEPLAGAEQPALPGSSRLFLLQSESFWGSLRPGASPEPQDPEHLAPLSGTLFLSGLAS